MLTDREHERCRRIAAALDAGDQRPWLKAEASLSPEAKGMVWDMRKHVIGTGQRGAAARPDWSVGDQTAKGAIAPDAPKGKTVDLDCWATDDIDPDDDDPGDDRPVCGACRGTGRDGDGNQCKVCAGRGRIPAEDQTDDGDEDEDKFEKKSCLYEEE